MNTPETIVYSKRRVLYGLNLAKKSKRSNIILVEGNIDVVMLHQPDSTMLAPRWAQR